MEDARHEGGQHDPTALAVAAHDLETLVDLAVDRDVCPSWQSITEGHRLLHATVWANSLAQLQRLKTIPGFSGQRGCKVLILLTAIETGSPAMVREVLRITGARVAGKYHGGQTLIHDDPRSVVEYHGGQTLIRSDFRGVNDASAAEILRMLFAVGMTVENIDTFVIEHVMEHAFDYRGTVRLLIDHDVFRIPIRLDRVMRQLPGVRAAGLRAAGLTARHLCMQEYWRYPELLEDLFRLYPELAVPDRGLDFLIANEHWMSLRKIRTGKRAPLDSLHAAADRAGLSDQIRVTQMKLRSRKRKQK
jgi:hypothetical protein